MSESDMQNLEIFKEYGARISGEKYKGEDPRTFFELMQEFNTMRTKLSKMKDLEARYDDIVAKKLAVEKDLKQAKLDKKRIEISKA